MPRPTSACQLDAGLGATLDFDRALIVDAPWVDMILDDIKCWEMRSTKTSIRGKIGLIKKGTGLIVGTVNLINSLPSHTYKELVDVFRFHRVPYWDGGYHKWDHPWVLENPKRFDTPLAYKHPKGAVVWVKINKESLCK